jgi:hypothetical protein
MTSPQEPSDVGQWVVSSFMKPVINISVTGREGGRKGERDRESERERGREGEREREREGGREI